MRRAPLLVVLALAATACSSAAAQPDELVSALCDAIAAPDVATAGRVFEAEAHTPLHEVADDLAAVDRPLATRLLEAKYAVESVVRSDTEPPAPLLTSRLEALTDLVREGLEVLDRPAPSC